MQWHNTYDADSVVDDNIDWESRWRRCFHSKDSSDSFRHTNWFPKATISTEIVLNINKSQGQTLEVINPNLREPVLSHGQLYAGCSWVGNLEDLFIYAPNGELKARLKPCKSEILEQPLSPTTDNLSQQLPTNPSPTSGNLSLSSWQLFLFFRGGKYTFCGSYNEISFFNIKAIKRLNRTSLLPEMTDYTR